MRSATTGEDKLKCSVVQPARIWNKLRFDCPNPAGTWWRVKSQEKSDEWIINHDILFNTLGPLIMIVWALNGPGLQSTKSNLSFFVVLKCTWTTVVDTKWKSIAALCLWINTNIHVAEARAIHSFMWVCVRYGKTAVKALLPWTVSSHSQTSSYLIAGCDCITWEGQDFMHNSRDQTHLTAWLIKNVFNVKSRLIIVNFWQLTVLS